MLFCALFVLSSYLTSAYSNSPTSYLLDVIIVAGIHASLGKREFFVEGKIPREFLMCVIVVVRLLQRL